MANMTPQELNRTLDQFRPKGVLKWCRLSNPNDGDRYNDGKYTTSVHMDKGDPEAEAFAKAVNDYHASVGGRGQVVKDGDVLNQKGFAPAKDCWIVSLKATQGANISFVDAAGNRISPEEFEDGDQVRFSCRAFDYSKVMSSPGVSLWMQGFQLIDKAPTGFDPVEGGYVSPKSGGGAAAEPLVPSTPLNPALARLLSQDPNDMPLDSQAKDILDGIRSRASAGQSAA